VAACICATFSATAQAQVMDELDIRREGANAVIEVKFVTPVQYSRAIVARTGDLVQVFYRVLPQREPLSLETSERRLPAGGAIGAIQVRDISSLDALPTSLNRKLEIRMGAPGKVKVRAGRTNRSIELVLLNLGSAVPEVAAAVSKIPVAQAVPAPVATPDATPPAAVADVDASATRLMSEAQSAFDGGNYEAATQALNQVLNLPPNQASRQAQEMIGLARLNAGDKVRAAKEFDLFLKLYPQGADSDRVRQLLATLPKADAAVEQAAGQAAPEPTATLSGSVSSFYYGGKSDSRTQEFVDSPLGGLPILQSETQLSNTDQKQIQSNVDLNWRYRDADKDVRFVFRDALTSDYLKSTNKNRLSALYLDYRWLTQGSSVRIGRQSPTGGGVMSRFDGVQAGYTFAPKWKVNAVIGRPTDELLDTRRNFYGVSVDAEALTQTLSGSFYVIEQRIDGQTDRRGLGTELRYFSGAVSASGQLDYDPVLRGVNIATVQANWQWDEATSFNAMLDRRTTPMLALGNVLFFQTVARRVDELLGTKTLQQVQTDARDLSAYQNQFRIGATHALSPKWQTGADFSVTSVGEIKPVAVLLPTGQAATGNLWTMSGQMIGSNLYSARDTHVFNLSLMGGPTYRASLLSYNNLSQLNDQWQLEPSLKYYTQNGTAGDNNKVWTAGMRATFKVLNQIALESELTYEHSNGQLAATTTGPGATTTASRVNYYLGVRVDF